MKIPERQILISVIIPAYNVEKYIEKCMDTVLNQTLKNIEIICIDDGSTDSTGRILDEYADDDCRVKIIHKQNTGYGNSMNIGNNIAKGQYLAIVEPDDYIGYTMLEELYEAACKNDLDFVKSNYTCFWGDASTFRSEFISIIQAKEMYNKILTKDNIKVQLGGQIANCTGIYKRDFIMKNNIMYNETPGASYQDVGFFFQVMMHAERAMAVDKAFYWYRQDNVNSSINSKEKVNCIFHEHEYIYRLLKKSSFFGEYIDFFQKFKIDNYIYNFYRISDNCKIEYLRRVSDDYKKSIELGEMKLELFWDGHVDYIKAVISNPDEYALSYIKKSNELYISVKDYQNVVIYGAGYEGVKVLNILKANMNMIGNVYFAISDKIMPYFRCGVEVRCIEDFCEEKEDTIVIIGVSEKYKKEIRANLKKLQFINILEN